MDFREYDIYKTLHFQFLQYKPKGQCLKWKFKKILRLLYRVLFKDMVLEYEGKRNTILYVDRFITLRDDIQEMLKNLTHTFDNRFDRLKWHRCLEFSFKRFFSNIIFCFKMRYLLKAYSFMEWIFVLQILLELKDLEKELKDKVPVEHYKLCFCYYDAETYQNFIIQYAKLSGCKTATLQHGVMLAPRNDIANNSDFDGHEFLDSVSDFFLVWNEFTKREALKAGVPKERLKVLGVVKCIGIPQLKPSVDSPYVGVFLDGELEKQNNIPLITIVQEWAKAHHRGCVFRYHPHFKGTEYEDAMDKSISKVCEKNVSLHEFIENVSFCVVANSTVLFELEYFCVPFLRYACDSIHDKYKDYPSIDFTSVDSFQEAYQKMIKMPSKKFVKADDNYASFFKQFIN